PPPPPTSTLFPYPTLFRSQSDWAYAPLLHGDFDAATQAGADAVDYLNAGMQSLTDGQGRPNLPTDGHRHLHRPAPLHDENHGARSEEHTSELQSLRHLVCR